MVTRHAIEKTELRYQVNSVDRCLRILEALAELGQEARVSTLCERLDLHSSTMVRFLSALMKRGFVEKNPDTGLYRLGVKCFKVGLSALNQIDLRKVAYPLLEKLSRKTHETVNLTVLQGKEVVCIERIDDAGFVNIQIPVGSRLPMYSSAGGKALLARLEDQQLDLILKEKGRLKGFTPNTITSYKALKKELAKIRQQGYAVDNEELYYGVRCVASTVFNHQDQVMGAVSVSGTTSRITMKRIPELAQLVLETSRKISLRLGYMPDSGERRRLRGSH
jgi:DNA-binding IclR family transcriptional regulator